MWAEKFSRVRVWIIQASIQQPTSPPVSGVMGKSLSKARLRIASAEHGRRVVRKDGIGQCNILCKWPSLQSSTLLRIGYAKASGLRHYTLPPVFDGLRHGLRACL